MATLKDVAKKAGVSTATVSRVLRNIGYIKDETHKKVTSAARELGYIANHTAQQLKKNSVKTVGFIISDINNPYYFNILSKLKTALREHGYDLIVSFSSENPEEEVDSFRSLIASRVSAILFTPTNNENFEIIGIAEQNKIKVIQLFRDVYPELDAVINDDESGCAAATRALLDVGCKRLLLVDVEYLYMDFDDVKPNRSVGFLSALKETAGIEYKIFHYPLVDYSKETLYKLIGQFKPDGIITATSNFGYVALSYINEKKLNAKLISFDDNKWLKLSSITAIKQNTDILINTISDMIFSDKIGLRKEKIRQELIIRG